MKTPEISEFLLKRTDYLIYNFNESTTDAFNNKLTGRNNQKFNSLISSIELLILKPGIEYILNKNFAFFGNLNNIANFKYQRWNNYPSYGINGNVGVKFSF